MGFNRMSAPDVMRDALALGGAVSLGGGLFAPLIRVEVPDLNLLEVDIGASFNMLELSHQGTAVFLALAGAALFLSGRRYYVALWITGMLALGLAMYSAYAARQAILQSRDYPLFQDPIGRRIGDLILQGVSLQWGWSLLAGGALLTVVAALVPNRSGKPGIYG